MTANLFTFGQPQDFFGSIPKRRQKTQTASRGQTCAMLLKSETAFIVSPLILQVVSYHPQLFFSLVTHFSKTVRYCETGNNHSIKQ